MLKFNEITSNEYYEGHSERMGHQGYLDNIVVIEDFDFERLMKDNESGEIKYSQLLNSLKRTGRNSYYTKMFYDRVFPYDNSYSNNDIYIDLELQMIGEELIDNSKLYFKASELISEKIVIFSEKQKSISIQSNRMEIRFVVSKQQKEELIYEIIKIISDFPLKSTHVKYTEYTKDGYRKHYKGEFINWTEVNHYRGTEIEIDNKIAQLQAMNISKELVVEKINSNKGLEEIYNEKFNFQKNKDLVNFLIINLSNVNDYDLLIEMSRVAKVNNIRLFLVNDENKFINGEILDNTHSLSVNEDLK